MGELGSPTASSHFQGHRKQTTPVGYFKIANGFGLSDLHGNVWEWCADDWHDNYNDASTDGSAFFDNFLS